MSQDDWITPEAEGAWSEGQEQADGEFGPTLADGDYQGRITISRIEHPSWDDSVWQLYLQWTDTQGSGTCPQWLSLDPNDEIGFSIAARVCKQLGYDGNLAGLRGHVEGGGFIDLVCDIRVKTKPGQTRDFKQVYVNRVHGKATDPIQPRDPGSDRPPLNDDDIPF